MTTDEHMRRDVMANWSDSGEAAASSTHLVLSDLTLSAVQAEATRAHLLHGEHSMLGFGVTEAERLAILTEEVGEVARELNEDRLGNVDHVGWRDRTVKELIQVAAMALTWVEHLEGGAR